MAGQAPVSVFRRHVAADKMISLKIFVCHLSSIETPLSVCSLILCPISFYQRFSHEAVPLLGGVETFLQPNLPIIMVNYRPSHRLIFTHIWAEEQRARKAKRACPTVQCSFKRLKASEVKTLDTGQWPLSDLKPTHRVMSVCGSLFRSREVYSNDHGEFNINAYHKNLQQIRRFLRTSEALILFCYCANWD